MSDSATMPAAALRRTDLPKLSLGTKTAATLLAIVAAVVLPAVLLPFPLPLSGLDGGVPPCPF